MLFVIVGQISCPIYAHACYVAQYLRDNMLDFNFKKEGYLRDDWVKWLRLVDAKMKWNHTTSPLIWRELSHRGGKEYYLGGINEFWEYVSDYYDLEYILPQTKLSELVEDNLQHFKYYRRVQAQEKNVGLKKINRICVCGATRQFLALLIPQLVRLQDLYRRHGLAIYIYNKSLEPGDFYDLEEEPDMYDHMNSHDVYIQVLESLEVHMPVLDLLIIVDVIQRDFYEGYMHWLERNLVLMTHYAKLINTYAKRNLRVIVQSPPVCFNATMLTKLVNTIRIHNVVAVTAHFGTEALNVVAQRLGLPTAQLSCPPVYGFIGINQLIDIGNIVQKAEIYRPNEHAIKNKGNSTLPLGETVVEVRPLLYATYRMENIWTEINENRRTVERLLQRQPNYAKITALINLLKYWYARKPDGEIISLGVHTSGSYGITDPLVFSQPCYLRNKFWRPYRSFPPPSNDNIPVKYLVQLPQKIVECMVSVCETPCICPQD